MNQTPSDALTIVIMTHRFDERCQAAVESASLAHLIHLHHPANIDSTAAKQIQSWKDTFPQLESFADVPEKVISFSQLRNQYLKLVETEWVLFLDSDEVLSPEFANSLTDHLQQRWDGYYLRRRDFFWGKAIEWGEAGESYVLRLARTKKLRFFRNVHETAQVAGLTHYLDEGLLHQPHQNLSEFFQKIHTYAQLEAELRQTTKKNFSWIQWVYPFGKFGYTYVFKLGFLDGWPGLIYSWMMSLHSLLVRIYWYEKTSQTTAH
jgi:hypothetical protein